MLVRFCKNKIGIEGTGRRVPQATIAILPAQPNDAKCDPVFSFLSWRNPISALLVSFATKAEQGDSNA
jgi:hypothetical protein